MTTLPACVTIQALAEARFRDHAVLIDEPGVARALLDGGLLRQHVGQEACRS